MDLSTVAGLVPVQWLAYAAALCGVCAALDAWLPQPRPGSRWVPVRKIVAALGHNYGWATNLVKPGSHLAQIEAEKAGA